VTSDYGPLDAISDISHSWLSGLAWSVAGHTIDTTLDMNNNDIDDIKNLNGSGNFTTTGDITADTYYGDGSQLTGLLKLDQTTPQTIINGVPLLDTTPNGGANLKSFVNKEYVDLAVTSLGAAYYMHDETDATGYKTCYLNPSGDAETYIEVSGLNNDDYIGGWISASGEEPQKLLKGIYDWYLTAEKTTGTETLRVYWQLIERYSNNSEVVIATSSNSNSLNGKSTYLVPLQLTEDYIPDSGSRIVGKLYADVSGSGNAPTIRVYYQGDTSSRWEIPANSEIFQNIFVPYNGAVQDVDLGSYNFTTTGKGSFGDGYFSGNVGIGTQEPLSILHIREKDLGVDETMFSSGSSHGYLAVEDEDARLGLFSEDEGGHGSTIYLAEVNSGVFNNTWSIGRLSSSFDSAFQIGYGTSPNISDLTTYFSILKNGKVGINKLTPSSLLSIKGGDGSDTSTVFSIFDDDDDEVIKMFWGDTAGGQMILTDPSGTNKIWLRGIGDSYFNGGNVGIGTTTPYYKLE
ncbi:MAG: hypothetical protein ACTSQG_05210, partial [Promethearchaeota archaeon]